jgi:hypothetical protein
MDIEFWNQDDSAFGDLPCLVFRSSLAFIHLFSPLPDSPFIEVDVCPTKSLAKCNAYLVEALGERNHVRHWLSEVSGVGFIPVSYLRRYCHILVKWHRGNSYTTTRQLLTPINPCRHISQSFNQRFVGLDPYRHSRGLAALSENM